jgi:hypothetical protein
MPEILEGSSVAALAVYNLGFALLHLIFWRWFDWPASLESAGPINAAVTQTLNLMLTYCFLAYGGWLLWCVTIGETPSPLLLIAGGGFWLVRAIAQPMLFSLESRISRWLLFLFAAGAAGHLALAACALS